MRKYTNKQLAELTDAFSCEQKRVDEPTLLNRGMHLQNNWSIFVFLMSRIEALSAGFSKQKKRARCGRGGWDVISGLGPVRIYSGCALVQIFVVG